jgi:hypothetical protein
VGTPQLPKSKGSEICWTAEFCESYIAAIAELVDGKVHRAGIPGSTGSSGYSVSMLGDA